MNAVSHSRYSKVHGRIGKSRGTRFLHRDWLNSRFTLDEIKTLPREQTALLCEVTRIQHDTLYYRPVYEWPTRAANDPEKETFGGCAKFPVSDFDRYCLKIVG